MMNNLLYYIAIILVIAWLVGFIGFGAGAIVHALIVIAVILIIFKLLSGNKTV